MIQARLELLAVLVVIALLIVVGWWGAVAAVHLLVKAIG